MLEDIVVAIATVTVFYICPIWFVYIWVRFSITSFRDYMHEKEAEEVARVRAYLENKRKNR